MFREWEVPDSDAVKAEKRKVFNHVTDVENTHSGYTRKIDNGFVDSEGEPSEKVQIDMDHDSFDRSDNLYDSEFIQTDA